MKCPFVGLCTLSVRIGTLSIDNETDDDDVSKPRQTGPRVLFSAGNMKFKQCSFPDRQRLFLCKELCLVTVLLWHSKTSVIASHKLWRWFNWRWRIYCSLRPGSFDFGGLLFITQLLFLFWKLKVYTDLEQLYLQLRQISAAEENSVLLQCSTIFVLSQYSS